MSPSLAYPKSSKTNTSFAEPSSFSILPRHRWSSPLRRPEPRVFGIERLEERCVPALLYLVADSGGSYSPSGHPGDDLLIAYDTDTGMETAVGVGMGSQSVEAAASQPSTNILFGIDTDRLGTIDLITGEFTPFADKIGSGNGAQGLVIYEDLDGITFDPFTGILYASVRTGEGKPDLLIQIDPTTGIAVADAFGAGIDYVEIQAIDGLYHVDDLAIDPFDGQMYAVVDNRETMYRLVAINKWTGETTDVGDTGQVDVEGLAFNSDGTLYATTGSVGTNRNRLWEVNKSTGELTQIAQLNLGGDFEAIAGLTQAPNLIAGTVFHDEDGDGVQDGSELGTANVTIDLFRDANSNGIYDAGDMWLWSTVTDTNGDYSFSLGASGSFVVVVNTGDLPSGHSLTTVSQHEVDFGTSFGNVSNENDFGHRVPRDPDPNLISGTVYRDTSEDGVLDSGEPGRPGVDVYLYEDVNNNGVIDADDIQRDATVTDINGYYQFTVNQTGNFLVTLDTNDLPSDFVLTTPILQAASFATIDGLVDSGNDFGFTLTPAIPTPNLITGTVFHDLDGDGVRDPGETGTPAAIVDLFLDANGNGIFDGGDTFVANQTTTSGDYSFVAGTGGTYFVVVRPETLPTLHSLTTVGLHTITFATPTGVTLAGFDFGHNAPATPTPDPIPDPDPPTGTSTPIIPPNIGATVGNAPGGAGGFRGAGYVSYVSPTFNTVVFQDRRILTQNLQGGGLYPIPPASIAGYVFEDKNNNGVMDKGEAGIGGVTIELRGSASGSAVLTTVTGPQGGWRFNNLRPGKYTVREVQPDGLLDGIDQIGTQGGEDSIDDLFVDCWLNPGEMGEENNFAELRPGTIAGTVFKDMNSNRKQDDDEKGIRDVRVTLVGTDDRGNPIEKEVRTDAHGDYEFDWLRPGSYTLRQQPLRDNSIFRAISATDEEEVEKQLSVTLQSGERSSENHFANPPARPRGLSFDSANIPMLRNVSDMARAVVELVDYETAGDQGSVQHAHREEAVREIEKLDQASIEAADTYFTGPQNSRWAELLVGAGGVTVLGAIGAIVALKRRRKLQMPMTSVTNGRDRRRHVRTTPPLVFNQLQISATDQESGHVASTVDESTGGLGIVLAGAETSGYSVGQVVHVQGDHSALPRLAVVRNVQSQVDGKVRLGLEWQLTI